MICIGSQEKNVSLVLERQRDAVRSQMQSTACACVQFVNGACMQRTCERQGETFRNLLQIREKDCSSFLSTAFICLFFSAAVSRLSRVFCCHFVLPENQDFLSSFFFLYFHHSLSLSLILSFPLPLSPSWPFFSILLFLRSFLTPGLHCSLSRISSLERFVSISFFLGLFHIQLPYSFFPPLSPLHHVVFFFSTVTRRNRQAVSGQERSFSPPECLSTRRACPTSPHFIREDFLIRRRRRGRIAPRKSGRSRSPFSRDQ